MRPEDYARVDNRDFDREYWAALWDRLPSWARKGVLTYALQYLHAIETSGAFSVAWDYEDREEGRPTGMWPEQGDLPGDVIKFKGEVRIGHGEAGQIDEPDVS